MLNQERTGSTLGPHPHPSPPEGQPGPFSKCCPRCPLCPGTQVLVQLSPQFHGCVSGLYGDFDGDASNDLRSRRGVLEPTAELATHSWHLSLLCPEPGELPHPCTVSTGRRGEREGGSCRILGRGVQRVGSGLPVVLCLQVNTHWAGWARTRCGVMLQVPFTRCRAEMPP